MQCGAAGAILGTNKRTEEQGLVCLVRIQDLCIGMHNCIAAHVNNQNEITGTEESNNSYNNFLRLIDVQAYVQIIQ